jgi:hypothetical protein
LRSFGNQKALADVISTARRVVGKAREETFSRLLDWALLNLEIAAALLKENNPANWAAMRRRAKLWLGNEPSTLLDLLEDEEEDAGLKRTVMERPLTFTVKPNNSGRA